ncbi:MAG TPA: hypothetical protein VFU19_18875 [Iamia sp.]|nr:hypothetical protein [Iamia sp.]
MDDELTLPIIDIDALPDRTGWAVVTLSGAFRTPMAVRVLGAILIELFGGGVDTVTVDARGCDGLSPAACHVLVDAARYTRHAGGCLVAAGLTPQDRAVLRGYDTDHRLDLAR